MDITNVHKSTMVPVKTKIYNIKLISPNMLYKLKVHFSAALQV